MNERIEFLKTVEPFHLLPDEVLQGAAASLQERKYRKDTIIYHQDLTELEGVDIIVKGQYDAFFYDSKKVKRLEEHYSRGVVYGGGSVLLNKKKSIRTVLAHKGTEILFLPKDDFKTICKAYDDFFHYFTGHFGNKMLNDDYAHFAGRNNTKEENYIEADQLFSRKIGTVEPRSIASCPVDTPIYRAAEIMRKARVSCLFVEGGENEIIGYVTDISLRDNVVAKRLDAGLPVSEVLETPVYTIDSEAYVYEAILMMFQNQIRYVLVRQADQYIGFLSRNRLTAEQAQSPFVFIQSVKLALSDKELKSKWDKVPEIVYQLLTRGVKAEIVNQVITAVSDSILLKVIDGALQKMGPPPAKFVFMALGSEGRMEQTLLTDQDNAIIYEDKANEQRETVRAYFLDFAGQVSDRLNAAGFKYCVGGYMAKNPKWTHSLSHWKRNYDEWMMLSAPDTVMNIATFFDCRYIYGDISLMDQLQAHLDKALQEPLSKFLYNMASNALQYEPPLTFFNTFRTFSQGEQKVFNMKKAMTPIVDLARMYALKNRIFKTNTGERLRALYDNGKFQEKEYRELLQAYYYLMSLRLKRQAESIINDKSEPDNFLDPHTLTVVEQSSLKEIFKVIKEFQQSIRMEFQNTFF